MSGILLFFVNTALRYELELQEQERGVAPNLSRVSKCFKILGKKWLVFFHNTVVSHAIILAPQN